MTQKIKESVDKVNEVSTDVKMFRCWDLKMQGLKDYII